MTFRKPLKKALADIPPVGSKGNKPYKMTMEHLLDSLIYYHLDIPDSGRHLLQVLEQDSFAREMIAPPQGIKKSSFFEKNSKKAKAHIGYRIFNKTYWIATDRFDLSAEQIAAIFLLRWKIEIFFGWWKRHLKVYHLLARSEHGLMIQLLRKNLTGHCCKISKNLVL